MAKFKFSIELSLNCETSEIVDIPDEDLEENKETTIDMYFNEWVWDNINTNIEEID